MFYIYALTWDGKTLQYKIFRQNTYQKQEFLMPYGRDGITPPPLIQCIMVS